MNARVETYALKAGDGSGRHVRMATKVIFEDGYVIRFIDRMGKREAITAATALMEKRKAHCDALLDARGI